MKRIFRRVVALVLAAVMVSGLSLTASAAQPVTIVLDGEILQVDAYVDGNGRTQAAFSIGEAMGLTVTADDGAVTFAKNDRSVAFKVGSTVAGDITLDTDVVENYVPLYFLATAFDFEISWDGTTCTVTMVSPADTAALIRTTLYGDVQGTVSGGANAWYGIPYAQAGRWEAPTAPDAWTEVLDCTEYGEVGIQAGMDYTTFQTVIRGSEDCQNLDVYAPAEANNLPVLVFIHGGNNQTGQSSEIPGSDLVITNNCVYVSLNFRMDLLGSNCLPALKTEMDGGKTGNFTLLDIAMALDWIKANISAFGGNPDDITVSGFSAGGRDVMAMLASPYFAGKFDKAIVFSGGMTIADEEKSAVQIAHILSGITVEDGKAADEAAAVEWLLSDSPDVAEYLKSVDAGRLISIIGNAGIRMAIFPHLYADDVILPSEGFDTSDYNNVPVLMLTGSGEFSIFNGLAPDLSEQDEDVKAAAQEFSLKYGSDMYRIFNAQVSANSMYDHYDAPIYVCQIDYDDTTAGALHGIFVPMLSSVHDYGWFGDFFSTPGYIAMAAEFNAYLTNFLHTGDPNGKNLDQWEKWNPDTQLSMVFDGDEGGAVVELKDVSKTYDDIIAEMEADTTVSVEVKMAQIKNVINGRWFSAAQDEHFGVTSPWYADNAE